MIKSKGAVSLKSAAALKNTAPGSVQEPGVGVKLSRDTKNYASRIYRIRDGISSLLAHEFRNNYPVRRTGEITKRCFGGVGLQEADSDLLPQRENRVLTPSAVQGGALRLLPRNLQFPGDRTSLPRECEFYVFAGRSEWSGS